MIKTDLKIMRGGYESFELRWEEFVKRWVPLMFGIRMTSWKDRIGCCGDMKE